MSQLAFNFFDAVHSTRNKARKNGSANGSQKNPKASARHDHGSPVGKVVALGARAARARKERQKARKGDPGNTNGDGPTREEHLGTLVWFTISNALRLTHEELDRCITESSLDPTLLMPREPGPAAALTRAADDAAVSDAEITEDRHGNPLDKPLYVNVLYRNTGRGVKQAVTEVLEETTKAAGSADHAVNRKKLAYKPLADCWVEDGELTVERVHTEDLLPPEIESLKDLRRYFTFEKTRHDGEKVRAVLGRAFDLSDAIRVKDSGGMYFVPRKAGDYPEKIQDFVGEVQERHEDSLARKARASTAFRLELVDNREYRELIEDSLEAHIKKESGALIAEMARTIKSDAGITLARQKSFIDRVKDLKESVISYEDLLEREATKARDDLDVAMKQATTLLTDLPEVPEAG